MSLAPIMRVTPNDPLASKVEATPTVDPASGYNISRLQAYAMGVLNILEALASLDEEQWHDRSST